jgi:ketosteroid isomerase-like protein
MSQENVELTRERAASFVARYGRAWQDWDIPGFIELFTDEVVYVAHATEETVVGRTALAGYLRKEATEQGQVSVRMGNPVIDDDRVAAEFWVAATSGSEDATIAGCFIAHLTLDGRCFSFREYWFDVDGKATAYEGWGE